MTRIRIAVVLAAVLLTPPVPAAASAAGPPRFPGPPVATEVSATSALLRWEPPDTDPAPTYYDIYLIENGQERTLNGSYDTSLLVTGLRPNRAYTYVVGVRPNGTHPSLRSPAVTVRTPVVPAEANAPTVPGEPVVTGVGPDQATLSFAASSDDSGIAEYDILEHRLNGSTAPFGATSVRPGHPGTEWTGRRLLPDYDYRFSVVAEDWFGNRSAPTAPVAVRTATDPDSSCRAGVRLEGTSGGRYTATVSVLNTGGPLDTYTIRGTLPAGQRNDDLYGWEFFQVGDDLLHAYAGWAGGFSAGETLQLTLVVRYQGAPVLPDGWRLNGQICEPL